MPPVKVLVVLLKLVRFPFTVNLLLLLPTVSVPLLVKLLTGLKLAPLLMVKLAPLPLVAKFLRPLVTPDWLTIRDEPPVSVMFAALVTMLAPGNCRVPVTL